MPFSSSIYIPPTVVEGPTFVSTTPMTIAQLVGTYPASATHLGKYARVTDLWGSVDEIMRCSSDGVTYYWRPQRTDYAVTSTATSGTMNLVPLISAPEIALQSTLVGNMTLALSSVNVWPGCQFKVRSPSSIGIFSLQFTGLIGGAVSNILGGSDKTAIYTSAGWRV